MVTRVSGIGVGAVCLNARTKRRAGVVGQWGLQNVFQELRGQQGELRADNWKVKGLRGQKGECAASHWDGKSLRERRRAREGDGSCREGAVPSGLLE